MALTASDIFQMLCRRHDKDIIFREVSTCESSRKDYGRFDAWAMRRAHANPMYWGYEIKVSRSDFLRDDKWPKYLPLCHQFYFVCPHGLIQPEELGEGCGLLWATQTGSRLMVKRKAAVRDVTPPESFWRSMIINRMEIRDDKNSARWARMTSLEECVKDKSYRRELGRLIRDARLEQIQEDAREREQHERQMGKYAEMLEFLERLGYPQVKFGSKSDLINFIIEKTGLSPVIPKSRFDNQSIGSALKHLGDLLVWGQQARKALDPSYEPSDSKSQDFKSALQDLGIV